MQHPRTQARSAARSCWLVVLPFLVSQACAGGSLPVEWDQSHSGEALDLKGMKLVFEETFDAPRSLNGPVLFAPIHARYGLEHFDPPGGPAYRIEDGALKLRAYKDQGGVIRSGMVQTADAAQSYRGAPITAERGFACSSCYFEARIKFPPYAPRLWGAFWLLSPDTESGHVEIDAVEWYGEDPKGHHAALHFWPKDRKQHAYKSKIIKIPELENGDWHTYGVWPDTSRNLITVFLNGKEIARVTPPPNFLGSPFYALASLAVNPRSEAEATYPFEMAVDYIRAYRRASE